MNHPNALLIFVKNPIEGKVKTRLASTIGNDAALHIYKQLVQHTQKIVKDLAVDIHLFYADFVPEQDELWTGKVYRKRVQAEGNLGYRMYVAFKQVLDNGYKKALIIGSDCWELESTHIKTAYQHLNQHDFVIGPAKDGGYYLLGMKVLCTTIFANKQWSSDTVLKNTIADIRVLQKNYAFLSTLNDVDYYEDLPEVLQQQIELVKKTK